MSQEVSVGEEEYSVWRREITFLQNNDYQAKN